jgi:ferredoxin-type protein NapG
MMSDERPVNRRRFFREGLRELLRPLAQSAKPLEEMIRQIGSLDDEMMTAAAMKKSPPQGTSAPAIRPTSTAWLRPPGALAESQFQDTCSRCGDCVRVCPVQCIKIDPAGVQGAGVPYIDVDTSPCVMCDGLKCMHACPTGALTPIPLNEIDMGTAVWHESMCLRSHGESCTICVDECPIGEMAIVVRDAAIHVIDDGCTGCGVCQNRCPTMPKSITVVPRASGGAVSRGRHRQ